MHLHSIVQTSEERRGMLIVQCILFPFLCNVMPPQLRVFQVRPSACDAAEREATLMHCPFDAHCTQLCHPRCLVSDNVLVLLRLTHCRGICNPLAQSASCSRVATSANPRLPGVAVILGKRTAIRGSLDVAVRTEDLTFRITSRRDTPAWLASAICRRGKQKHGHMVYTHGPA